jgi:serine protease Do
MDHGVSASEIDPSRQSIRTIMTRFIQLGLCVLVLAVSAVDAVAVSAVRETAVVKAIRRAQGAVVNIHSEKTADGQGSLFSVDKGRKINGMGTGIIIDERGYIVTNHHVVDGVDTLRVTTREGSAYTASVVSYDRKHDLAIIKVNATRPLMVMPLGTSSDVMLGETVIAIGNAYGYEHTMTGGLVSALARDVEVNEKQSYRNLIQTDASINPGNSGGPLINLDGEVIGINVAIRAGAQRIGFAIPIDDARRVIAQLLNIEKLSYTWHGLVGTDIKAGEVRQLSVDSTIPDSPAAKAGLEPGDIIERVGRVKVQDGADFERACLGRKPAVEMELIVRRDNATRTLKMSLAQASDKLARSYGAIVRTNKGEKPSSPTSRFLRQFGIQLDTLDVKDRPLVGPRYRGGMRVTGVRPNSPAARNGIKKDDILVGLHIWETVNIENVDYVIGHPQLRSFSPLKFYVLRGDETLWGHLPVTSAVR